MTTEEAEQGAAERHEFRKFSYSLTHGPKGICWCGDHTLPCSSERAARKAHRKHQAQEALQRSFEPRAHP